MCQTARLFEPSVIAITFGIIFIGELPDKTGIACLILGTRFPWRWVFAGVATAFVVHVVIAVAAGSVLSLLPHRVLDIVVAVLFGAGAVLLWLESRGPGDGTGDVEETEAELTGRVGDGAGFFKVASVGFGVIIVAEWGDLTQILTANLAAKYDSPISVGIGSVLALWSVALLAMLAGRSLLRVLPMRWITRAAAVIMAGFCAFSVYEAITA